MFDIPIDGPCNIFCDNEAVTKSSMNPESTLNKKNISIAFHQAREAVAAGIALIFMKIFVPIMLTFLPRLWITLIENASWNTSVENLQNFNSLSLLLILTEKGECFITKS